MTTPFFNDLSMLAAGLPAKELEGKRILITGATGLIGSTVARILLQSDIDLRIYVASRSIFRLQEAYSDLLSDTRLHPVEFDVVEPLRLEVDFNYIMDCASPGNPGAFLTRPVDIIKANVMGVCNLLEYGLAHGMERFLYVSSGEVYGEGDGRDFTEEYSGYVNPCDVRSCYPASKRAAESLCISYAAQYGADIRIARPCHTFGPNFSASDDRAYAQFFRNVISGNDIVLKSPGTQVRSWLYVADCADALLHILLHGDNSTAYNISSEHSTASIRRFAEITAQTGGTQVVFDIPEGIDKNAIISRGVLDPSRLRATGWQPHFTLEEGIRNSIDTLSNDE